MTRAVVVGSGPNGLAAATVLARAGVEVTVVEAADVLGGGARSVVSPRPGLIQDHCAAVHPMAPMGAFWRTLDLDAMGIALRYAPIDCAHPLDDGSAGVLHTSVTETAAGLGADGPRWEAAFGRPSRAFAKLSEDIMTPMLGVPRHPFALARFGLIAGPPPTWVARFFRTERARALFLGVAAHAINRIDVPLVGGIGAGIITAGHAVGWPVIEGGTGVFTDAMVRMLDGMGVTFETSRRIRRREDLPAHDLAILDVHPHDAATILQGALPERIRRAYRRSRSGPAAFKVDFAVRGGIPWLNEEARLAGTVHVAGSAAEVVAAEHDAAVLRRMPERPFVLVGQQYLADPSRADGDTVPVYAYAHVPSGYRGDATAAIVRQIERFAPGFRDRILATRARTTMASALENPNFVNGDILTGAKTPIRFLTGPRITPRPYDTGVPGYLLCSAATPPGPGIHGMSGYNAARRALQQLGLRTSAHEHEPMPVGAG
ncbi:NAD(P)/FAD-dependent oxidoreductase [Microbacterium sp.]|uniref:phytoene desaturase family protein n=1 Tax=Microbacterium sp. TaxID=51671 RepID=UPI001AC00C56|nr:NAD(P)/FAD-dependent oxidoreductase [Microbacterium sp.]MBN9157561.1 NAD(P)/FAD-dependent oxidoreductase [Microbacterium sp.]